MTDERHSDAAAERRARLAPADEERVLHAALGGLTDGIRARLDRHAAEPLDWVALIDELRRRGGSLGMSEQTGEVDDFGFDAGWVRRSRPFFDLLAERWFRLEARGLANVPDGPVLFVANRGGLLPWDGLMISHGLERRLGEAARPRFLVADWLITLPFAQPALARLGGVRACQENAERLLRTGRSVVAFPEGVKGAAKVYADRYRLQRFGRGGAVRLALETGCPVVPVAVVGADDAHPVLFKIETLARSVGLPFVPVTPTFPWLGPLGAIPLPARWTLEFGEPLDLDPADHDELAVLQANETLRRRIQSMLDAELRARAQAPTPPGS